MYSRKIFALLLSLSLATTPQIGVAQTVEQLIEQATAAQEAGQYLQAEAFWRNLIQRDPKNIDAYVQLAEVLEQQQKFDQAIAVYHQAITSNPRSTSAYSQLGDALVKQEKFDEAVIVYRKAIELTPNQESRFYEGIGVPSLHFKLAQVFRQQQKFDQAITHYRQVIELFTKQENPSDQIHTIASYVAIGDTLKQQGKLDEAITHYETALKLDSDSGGWDYSFSDAGLERSFNTNLSLGLALYERGGLDAVVVAYRQLEPERAKIAYSVLAKALANQQKIDDAIAAYRQAIQIDPKSTQSYLELAMFLERQNRLAEAIAHYRQYMQLSDTVDYNYLSIGNALQRYNQPQEANAIFDQLITESRRTLKADPKNVNVSLILGLALEKQNKFDEAIAVYRQGIQLASKSEAVYSYYILLGRALDKQDKPKEAMAAFNQVMPFLRQQVQNDPQNEDSPRHFALGIALDEQNQLEAAITHYRKAIALFPKDTSEENYQTWIYLVLGDALRKQNKLDEAITAYRQALQFPELIELQWGMPSTAHTLAHNGLGLALQKQGKLSEAIAEFKRATQLDAGFVEAQNHLQAVQQLMK